MAVGQRLSLRQSQSLALTPGLRQSLELMQLSASDLAALVARKLEENPFLERDECPLDRPGTEAADEFLAAAEPAWSEGADWADATPAAGPTLAEQLAQQVRLGFAGAEQAVALALLAELDEAGYLPARLPRLPGDPAPALVEQVVRRLQRLGPPGLFARSLAECLRLQLADRGLLDRPFDLLLDNLPLVAAGQRARLLALAGLEEPELLRRLQLLRGLDPKPALSFTAPDAAPAIADLEIAPDETGRLAVRLNAAALPRLRVNLERRRSLKGGLRRADDKAYVAARTAEAGWLVRALVRRGQSLLALGQELSVRQEAFFREGFPALRPLTRQAMAAALGLSESTVSRLVANKYLASPQGLLPLARLFSAGLGDGSISAGAVAARLAKLIAAEAPGRPLSDQALALRLAAEGFPVARRTLAKYRAQLKIPPASRRRRRALMGAGGAAVDSPRGRH